MNNRERAEKILTVVRGPMSRPDGTKIGEVIDMIAAHLDEAVKEAVRDVHRDIAAEQALIHGEAVMLGGKLVTNEEFYKQPTDYVKEAFAEGYAAGKAQAAGK